MLPPFTNCSKTPLRHIILDRTSIELGKILNYVFCDLTDQFQEELRAYAPADTNECTRVVEIWITRLNVIRSALASFPTLTGSSTPGYSVKMPDSNSGTTLTRVCTPVQHTACMACDQYQCIITGRKLSEGFRIEVAHIILFALASHPDCQNLDVWKMLEMFYGPESTNTLFTGVHNTIHGLENPTSLDSSIYSSFITGGLNLIPTHEDYPIHPLSHYTGDYWLSIDYCSKSGKPELIQSTNALNTSKVRTLLRLSKIHIAYHEQVPGLGSPSPLLSYFALRAFVLRLNDPCEYTGTPPWPEVPGSYAATYTPSSIGSIDRRDGVSTDEAAFDYASADSVLAASAILQQLVDSGLLGRLP